MGGRLDATNVLHPLVTVVTRLSLEHTEWLGHTIRQIAGEKAGILKEGVPCVTLRQPVLGVVRGRAKALGVPLIVVPEDVGFERLTIEGEGQTVEVRGRLGTYRIQVPLAGAHQAENAAMAVAALEVLRGEGWRIPPSTLRRGIASTRWPARLEIRWRHPLTIVDCAHTTQGARATARTVREQFRSRRLILVVGILTDKDLPGMMHHLAPLASEAICVRPKTERAFAPEVLAAELEKHGVATKIIPGVAEGLAAAMATAGPADAVLLTGSLYTAGEALTYLEGRWRSRIEETLRILQATHMPGEFPGDFPATTLAKVRKATEDPFVVLISTIMSQRTRDPVTEAATWRLFAKYPDAQALARAPLWSIERLIRPVNFYPTKARAIKRVAKAIAEEHGGQVPRSYDELLELPMVGPKTAACTLVYGFGDDSHIPIDTHAHRIPNRLGWVLTSSPEETERALAGIVPRDYWLAVNELFVRHGQTICLPANPHCPVCPINHLCDYGIETMTNRRADA
jgi:endonuclease III